ncbi:shikimate kinase [mine drainage metagenome]|uniref:shikimate kinase n=1 Tax=mine drainage metagenome TaxID=410659 RepID=T0Z0K7_9ZZZZ
MARLVLVGLPGVGKSTVARALAARWACDWCDTDDLVAVRVGVTVGELLRTRGEAALRDVELDVLREALASESVVATGGGVVSRPAARTLLRGEPTIWLDCADEVALSRVSGGDRPLLGRGSPRRLGRAARAPRDVVSRGVARARRHRHGLDEVVAAVIDASGRTAPCG